MWAHLESNRRAPRGRATRLRDPVERDGGLRDCDSTN
ncbi:hypothetical protein CLV98_101688 [Dyadobacter jejuensis]|uniref:Uncharacterized protein n=1 Tax=Dyadobacter jejuensis TaxID=1082580 RepID=A0A316AT91_9BACT|nr:hypothetical protein CLV98_101688 [Dyadobacter jejuensis]